MAIPIEIEKIQTCRDSSEVNQTKYLITITEKGIWRKTFRCDLEIL